jgi:hypothetical protein
MAKTSTRADEQRPITAEEFAADLSDRLLHCRELGHTWRPFTVTFDKDSRSYDRRLRCASCRTIRKQLLDSRGHVIRNGYDYSDGYLAKNLVPGGTRDAYRVEAIVRFLAHVESQAS